MQRDADHPKSSLPGNREQRRPREIHKLHLSDLPDLSAADIGQMVATGDIELMVRGSDIADGEAGGWGKRIARLFEDVAGSLESAPGYENRTIIVNIVSVRPGGNQE